MTDETTSSSYRTYEVYQRERVGETTNLVNPRDLISDEYLADPFTVPGVLRKHYPCYRDWVGNRFWVTRYDDVTSVFVDDANYETRPSAAAYGQLISGTDLRHNTEVQQGWVDLVDNAAEAALVAAIDSLGGECDLAIDFVDRFAADVFSTALGVDGSAEFGGYLTALKAGAGWDERDRIAGVEACSNLQTMLTEWLADRKSSPADDLLSVLAQLDASADDVVATLLEIDLETLPASLANTWCLLLNNGEQFAQVRDEPRLMKFAYLEALRHSPPQATADRFTRHEVERFGRLLPKGALVHLSAAAANRDPQYFADPDSFDVTRKDLCQREPRGQYRADGLPAGVVFAHGRPSRNPALPKEAPRSSYAQTRDLAVRASLALLERFPNVELAKGNAATMSQDRLGGTYRCRKLQVRTS